MVKYCIQCGTEIKEGQVFCPNCGKAPENIPLAPQGPMQQPAQHYPSYQPPMQQKQPVQQYPTYLTTSPKKSNIKSIVGIALIVIILVFCLVLYFVVFQGEPEEDAVDSSIIASWDFNEGTGNTLNDKNGNADGTITGATWTEDPVKGTVLSFDGYSDYVDLTDFDVGNSFTISLWINPTSSSNKRCFIGKHSNSGENLFLIGYWDYGYNVRIRDDKYVDGDRTTGWQHLTVVCKQTGESATQVTYYKNGTILWEHEFDEVLGDASGKSWTIGQDWDSSNSRTDFFKGYIDKICFYDRALTAEEVRNL